MIRLAVPALVLLLAQAASATSSSGVPVTEVETAVPTMEHCGPPCGYIQPFIDLEFPDKAECRDESECLPLPAVGETVVFDGQVRWYWEVSQDGTYPSDPDEDIHLSFQGTAANPAPFSVSVTPASFTITQADLLDPARFRVDATNPAAPRIWYEYVQPIQLTIERSEAALDEDDLGRLEARNGVLGVFLRGVSSPSGTQFYAGFGLEEFRFQAADLVPSEPVNRESPGVGVAALVAVLVVASTILVRRR